MKKVGRFEEPVAATYTAHILAAMRHLHSMNIIHRDLKPENILICDGNVAKLTDFGWSVHTSKHRKTFCGTIDYICPEILNRQPYDTRLDLWTVGVLAFELASGRAPFESSSRHETSRKIKSLEYQFPPHFSPLLIDFVQKMLTVDPRERMTEDQALSHPWITGNRLN
jgi:aurora kinase, other